MAKKITGRHCLKLPLMCLIICAWQAGSCRLFGSAPLKGLGMAFRIEIVKKYGWPATSMVEDQELSLLLEQDNIAVHYNPQDIIRSAMKSDAAVAEKQRVRWEDGRFGLIEKYAPVFFPATLIVVLMIAIELCLYVISGQLQRGLSLKGWVYLLTAPLFIIWKLSIYIIQHQENNLGSYQAR